MSRACRVVVASWACLAAACGAAPTPADRVIGAATVGFLNSFNYPGIGLHEELAVLVASGLTPAQALQASVVNGPAFFKAADYGAVAAGKAADLLVLDRNPLADITATRAIRAVVVKGQPLDRAALDTMLAGVEARAASRPSTTP